MAIPAAALLFVGVVAGLPADDGEIESGVQIGGYQVTSGNWEQTASELDSSLQSYLDEPVTLQLGDRSYDETPSELGISFDMDATYDRAMDVGRGGIVDGARERFTAHASGVNVSPVVTYDSDEFIEALTALSQGVVVPPSNASFAFENGKIVVNPSKDGVGINTHEAAAHLESAAGEFDHGPVEIPTVAIVPEITTADLDAVVAEANRLAGEPIRILDGNSGWQIESQELMSLLNYSNGTVELNMDAVAHRIGTLSAVIDTPAKNAAIEPNGDGTFKIVPESIERKLDLDASMDAVQRGIVSGDRDVALVVNEQAPPVTDDRLQPLYQQISDIMSRGMLLTWPDGEQWLAPQDYASVFQINEQEGTVSIDRTKLTQLIQPIADGVNRPVTGLRWKGGQLVTTEDTQPGRQVDVAATVDKAAEGALGGSPVVEMAIGQTEDPMQAAGNIQITDMLANAQTYYGDSSANRATNVEVAAAALDGALIPPHGTFSFNNAIGGTATLEDGYQMGYGIITGSDGVAKTVPSVAGGICQVATTTFQAAFWAGMEIGNRNWHLYWIPSYGEGIGGMKGLDATVDPDYDLDFTFNNPTDKWIAVQAYADGAYITVEVWGVNQNWTVDVDEPVITNAVAADTETVYHETSDELEPGQEVRVEVARDGFSAAIHRVVKDGNGQVVSDRTFESYYQPSRNVILTGE